MNKLAFTILLLLTVNLGAQPPDSTRRERQPLTRPDPERTAKARDLLAQARAALSQNAKLEDLKTLSVDGTLRRLTFTATTGGNGFAGINGVGVDVDPTVSGAQGQREKLVNGKVEYAFALPEKFHWEEEVGQQKRKGYLNGDRFWLQGAMMPPNAQVAAMMQQKVQSDYAYLTLGLLLAPPPGFSVEYSYAEERPFQQTIAEVVVISGPGVFKAELYLDQKSHLPLLLRFVMGGIPRPVMVFTPPGTSREEAMRRLELAQQQAAAKPPGQQEREKLVLFEDYRAVDGVLFPHKISTQINGKLIEELTFTQFKVNQTIKPEKFREKQ